jgi:hypothetical protein
MPEQLGDAVADARAYAAQFGGATLLTFPMSVARDPEQHRKKTWVELKKRDCVTVNAFIVDDAEGYYQKRYGYAIAYRVAQDGTVTPPLPESEVSNVAA